MESIKSSSTETSFEKENNFFEVVATKKRKESWRKISNFCFLFLLFVWQVQK
jgi:hypothetical protein